MSLYGRRSGLFQTDTVYVVYCCCAAITYYDLKHIIILSHTLPHTYAVVGQLEVYINQESLVWHNNFTTVIRRLS